MSNITIDSSLVAVGLGSKTAVKEQPAKGKGPQVSGAIVPCKATAKELKAQLSQLGIDSFNPWIAEPDVTGQKTISGLALKDLLLKPIREIAYKICSHFGRYEGRSGFKSIRGIFESLVIKNRSPYAGLHDGVSQNDPCFSKPAPNIFRIYLCLDPNTLPLSDDRPQSISDIADQTYYSIKPWSKIRGLNETQKELLNKEEYSDSYYDPTRWNHYIWPTKFLHELLQLKPGEIGYLNGEHYYSTYVGNPPYSSSIDLGSYLLSFGRDKQGIYLSIRDIWAINTEAGWYNKKHLYKLLEKIEPMMMSLIGKPIYIYDRYYLSEKDIKDELDCRPKEDR